MKVFKNKSRYELLLEQFDTKDSSLLDNEMKRSLHRLFQYIYSHTNITFIEFINEDVLYNYIIFNAHNAHNQKGNRLVQAIKDVKYFIYYLKQKNIDKIPKINLSVGNYKLWVKL